MKFDELEEVVPDTEVAVINQPLLYVEDDIELPVLTPNAMMHVQSNLLPEEAIDSVELKVKTKLSKWLGLERESRS